MTTVKNALTILKSKCFISKIEVNIKYIGSRNRALYASAAQESVYVHVGVSVCFGSLFAFVCFVWVFFFFVSVVILLQVIAVALNCVSQRFYIPKHSVPAQKYTGTLGAANGQKNALRILSRSSQSFVTIHSLPIHALST